MGDVQHEKQALTKGVASASRRVESRDSTAVEKLALQPEQASALLRQPGYVEHESEGGCAPLVRSGSLPHYPG